MGYLGASLKSVKEAYAKGRITVIIGGTKNKYVGVHVHGFDAEDLTIPLANEMIRHWWASGPGTKVVVGWVHSDTAEEEMGPSYAKLALAEVVRPPGTDPVEVANKLNVDMHGYVNSNGNDEQIMVRDIFEHLLYTAVKRVDDRLRYINPGYEVPNYWSPTFNTDSGYRAGTSVFVIWPPTTPAGLPTRAGKKTNGAKQCPTKCTTAQVCNPASARCVNRNGVVGKRVLAVQSGAPVPAPAPVAKKTKPAQNTTVRTRVNAGKRVAQAVPKSARPRKAPAGHAKD